MATGDHGLHGMLAQWHVEEDFKNVAVSAIILSLSMVGRLVLVKLEGLRSATNRTVQLVSIHFPINIWRLCTIFEILIKNFDISLKQKC